MHRYLTEEDVGMNAYTTSEYVSGRLRCVFRERYSDFIVHEIDIDGHIVELNDQKHIPISEEDEAISILSGGDALQASKLEKVIKSKEGSVVLKGTWSAVEVSAYIDDEDFLLSEEEGALRISIREKWGTKNKKKKERKRMQSVDLQDLLF
mmetsp:Transcript_2335/g.3117  ORF Transcript_2335/g.3117 Transcript_2335/m.3117 type:complete len:151 (+) Transcript_2335:42-494(+)